jgi:peptidoglycan/xylan/chitin deacetylase (PgdA/CDA1 family)
MFAEEGYSTISLARVIECLSKAKPFPERTLVLTFDDGYETTYKEAFPLLQKLGMTATVFLATGNLAEKRGSEFLPTLTGRKMLSWDNIREMNRAGIEFGSHTLTHPDLTRMSMARVNREVHESKTILEDKLGSEVFAFAYPFGYHTRTIRDIVKKHYVMACSGRLGVVTQSSKPFALERIDMYYFRTTKLSHLLLSRLFPFYVKFRNVPRQIKSVLRRGRLL